MQVALPARACPCITPILRTSRILRALPSDLSGLVAIQHCHSKVWSGFRVLRVSTMSLYLCETSKVWELRRLDYILARQTLSEPWIFGQDCVSSDAANSDLVCFDCTVWSINHDRFRNNSSYRERDLSNTFARLRAQVSFV